MSQDPRESSGQRSWWTSAWADVLDAAGPSGTRAIQRGRALVRRGAVEDVEVVPGAVTGRVRESRGASADVELRWALPPDGAWASVVDRLAGEVRFSAALLDGVLPDRLDEVMDDIGLRIVPRLDDLDLRCSCHPSDRLCRHIAAVHAASSSVIERDPFALFRLRGKSREELLSDVRAHRGESDGDLVLGGLDLSVGLTAARGDLDAVPLHPVAVEDPAALFRHLGTPPGVEDGEPIAQLIERAAAGAWRLAAGEGSDAADEEVLLAELRAQRTATPTSLAAALGRDADAVREDLDRLYSDGVVMRTGTGDGARYRAGVRAPAASAAPAGDTESLPGDARDQRSQPAHWPQ